VPAAGRAAARRTDAHLTELRAALFDPAVDDPEVMLHAHAAFHSAMAKATGNPLFELVTRPLYHVRYGEDVVDDLPDRYWARIDADHRELLECVRRGDPEAATGAARSHLDYIAEANRH
jgi:GntR family transcriptional repressor for pyruvate dehydrogenase complex